MGRRFTGESIWTSGGRAVSAHMFDLTRQVAHLQPPVLALVQEVWQQGGPVQHRRCRVLHAHSLLHQTLNEIPPRCAVLFTGV